jgi:hypothetical protein
LLTKQNLLRAVLFVFCCAYGFIVYDFLKGALSLAFLGAASLIGIPSMVGLVLLDRRT